MERADMLPSEIDECMTLGAGHPMGPLRLLDFVGIDVAVAIGHQLQAEGGDGSHAPPPSLERLVAEGLRILIVEQNLTVATAVAQRLLVMLNGRIVDETTPGALEADPGAKLRYLGVTPRADGQPDPSRSAARAGSETPEGAQ
jgi:hypothetical protein